jgi:hypothetical protein
VKISDHIVSVVQSSPKNTLLGNLPSIIPRVALKPIKKAKDYIEENSSFIKSDFEIDEFRDHSKLG